MPRLRRNGGLGQIMPREGVITHVEPEVMHGRRGAVTPAGTRLRERAVMPQPAPIRNDMPVLLYDPTRAGRAARAVSSRYAHARQALARAAAIYGPPPATIRGLPGSEYLRSGGRGRKPVPRRGKKTQPA